MKQVIMKSPHDNVGWNLNNVYYILMNVKYT